MTSSVIPAGPRQRRAHLWGRIHGATVPINVDGGGSGPQPDSVPETFKVPGLGDQPPLTKGGKPALPATSVQAVLQGGLSMALKNASIIDEHRALMGAVIEKIQSAERGLNESCHNLIKGFEAFFRNL